MSLLLLSGEPELRVYGDASAFGEMGFGAWAFDIANFKVGGEGIESGDHVERFELSAAIHGMEAAVRLDASSRPIRIHTDSSFVRSVLILLAESKELPSKPSFDRVRDLFDRGMTALAGRRMVCFLANNNTPGHRRCHNRALAAIKSHIQNDLDLRTELAIKREERKLSQVLKERAHAEANMVRIDVELALIETRVQALRNLAPSKVMCNG